MAEKIGFSPKDKNLLNLGIFEQQVKELVKVQNGSTRIFIHPFHRLHCIKDGNGVRVSLTDIVLQAEGKRVLTNEEKELLDKEMTSRRDFNIEMHDLKFINGNFTPAFNYYLKSLARVLRANPHLLMLGEESGHVEETIAAFRQLGFNKEILYYRTREASPQIQPNSVYDLSSLAKVLSSLGVQNLLVGGQYSTFYKPEYDKALVNSNRNGLHIFKMKNGDNDDFVAKYTPITCVGGFARLINDSKLFDSVIISQVSFPDAHPSL